jgi:hypothetical protein
MPDGSMARGDGSGGDGDEAVWLELVAKYDAPLAASDGEVPWPEREDLTGPVRVSPADALPDSVSRSDPGVLADVPPFGDTPPVPEAQPLADVPPLTDDLPLPGPPFPSKPSRPVTPAGVGPGRGPRDAPIPENPADDHYVPPPAPPLPKLEPVTKGAWLALFGGPLYLIIATIVGWTVSGLAAFLAVAAFVGGFAVLVLRMDSGPPKDRGPDDGAVV